MTAGTVLTFGEALLRLSLPTAQALEDVGCLEVSVGGAELNVAVALAHLGTPAAWCSALPDTPLGERVRRVLRAAGVGTDHVTVGPGRLGTYFLEDHHAPRPSRALYDRADSSFARMTPDGLPPQVLAGVTWLHVTGISLAVSEPARRTTAALLQAARAQGCRISVDVNHRRLLLPDGQAAPTYGPALALADLIFCAERDAPLVLEGWPRGPDADGEALLAALHARYPQATVVLTRGAQGSAARAPGGQFARTPALPAAGPGRIGRGDAFSAAFLHLARRAAPLAACLEFAAAAAALKTTMPGDQLRACEAEVRAALGPSPSSAGEPRR